MVRTRFAPSPTGYMHIGNLRTALYEYLIAKSQGGKFVLRIEDTDQERLVEGSLDAIYNTLALTGLHYDEGPGREGPFGPYIQSERKEIYQEHAKKLIASGHAYRCFCTKERLAALKEQDSNGKYDRHCLFLTEHEIQQNLDDNIPFVIRQKMPLEGTTTFSDTVFGDITVPNEELDDQVLVKSDGMPTYNFANVVDDHLMEITHVVRGSEYLSSTPKYNLLYDAFGWPVPVYIHLPPVMKNASQKLSKRHGDASFEDLIEQGFLPEAVLNYIALLGWSPEDNQEIFSLEELVKAFHIQGLSKSPSIFDLKKLTWMNSEYIKKMDPKVFYQLIRNPLSQHVHNSDIDLEKLSGLLQTRLEVLTDIPQHVDFLNALPDYDTTLYIHKKMKTTKEIALANLISIVPVLEDADIWEEQPLHDLLMDKIQTMEVKNGQVFWPIRTALSGKESSPGGAIELLYLLGKDESLNRLKIGIQKLQEDCGTE